MGDSIFPTPYKLTSEEILLSSASTLIFKALESENRGTCTISQICEHPQYGFTASAEAISNGPRFVRITDIKGGKINWASVPYCTCETPDNYILKTGDILVARAGSVGKSILVDSTPENAIFASYMIRFRPLDGILPGFVYWFFQSQSFWLQIEAFNRGSAMKNINSRMLSELVLPRASLSEQQAIASYLDMFREKMGGKYVDLPNLPPPMQSVPPIVARIEALAGRVAEARHLRREAREEAKNISDHWISQKFNYTYEDSLPTGWRWLPFSQTLEPNGMRTGPFGTLLSKSEILSEGIQVLGIANIGSNQFKPGFTDYVTPEKAQSLSAYTLNKGDIVVARSGTVGRSCVIPGNLIPKPIMSSNLIRIRVDRKIALPELICQILNGSSIVEKHKEKECRGSTRLFFTQKILNKFQIPIPPLAEQQQIIAYLNQMQEQIAVLHKFQNSTAVALDALLPSILDRAFKGEL